MRIFELLDSAIRMLDCGTGAGGFKEGNTCSKGGDSGGFSEKDVSIQYYKNIKNIEDIVSRANDLLDKLPAKEKLSASKKIREQNAKLGKAFWSGFRDVNIYSDGGEESKRVPKIWKSKEEFNQYKSNLNNAIDGFNGLLSSLAK